MLCDVLANESIVEHVRLAAPVCLDLWCDQYQPCPMFAKRSSLDLMISTACRAIVSFIYYAVRLPFPYLAVMTANRIARQVRREFMSLIHQMQPDDAFVAHLYVYTPFCGILVIQ